MATDHRIEENTHTLRVISDRADDRWMIELRGELDIEGIPQVELAIARAERAPASHLRLDLSGLRFMDSMGIRLLLALAKRAEPGWLAIVRPGNPEILEMLEVIGVADRLPWVD